MDRKSLVLTLPKGGDNLLGETTKQRLVGVARALDRKAEVAGALRLTLSEG